jgi:hypothetical protein
MQYTFLQNNIQLSRRIIFLLLFFCSFSFASYKSIYNIENPEFKYSIEGNNYKVYMSEEGIICLLYTSPSPRDRTRSRMPSSA